MSEKEAKELKGKILEGISLAFQRMVEQKKRNDENLVVYQNGQVIVVKARDWK